MDILRSYKILELDHEASMNEVREAYIDMAMVWNPDRFTDNPRLRKKAEGKLKEINTAYAEIRVLLCTGPEIHRTKKAARWVQGALEAICKDILAVKEIARNPCSSACTILRETDFKQLFRQLLSPKIELRGIANRQSQNNDSISRGAGRMGKGQDTQRNFADVYEEVARAKKEGKRKMGGLR